MTQFKVLVVDDHPVFRQGMRDVLETDERFLIVGEASDGKSALALSQETKPDLVLMDINLPGSNGLQVTRKLVGSQPETKVVIITGYDEPEQMFHALRAGAHAYCSKDAPPDELIAALAAVHEGKYVVEGQTLDREGVMAWAVKRMGRFADPFESDPEELFVPLSPREMEILELVTKGSSNKDIAFKLGISHQTVKNHMTAILRKLRVSDRTQAAVYALHHGWVRLEDSRQQQ